MFRNYSAEYTRNGFRPIPWKQCSFCRILCIRNSLFPDSERNGTERDSTKNVFQKSSRCFFVLEWCGTSFFRIFFFRQIVWNKIPSVFLFCEIVVSALPVARHKKSLVTNFCQVPCRDWSLKNDNKDKSVQYTYAFLVRSHI